MKKTMGAIAALVAMMATLLLGTATAHATVPPSQCQNTGLVNIIVVCDIDVDDNSILNGNDVEVLIPVRCNLSYNQLVVLAKLLDDLNLELKNISQEVLAAIIADIIGPCIGGPIIVLPYS